MGTGIGLMFWPRPGLAVTHVDACAGGGGKRFQMAFNLSD